jgi:hypothetical protein
MAKKEEFRNPKSKITVMMFQLEGTDETLQEGIRTIGNAIGAVLKPMRAIAPKANNGGTADLETETEVAEVVESEETSTEDNSGQERETKTAKPRSPKVLDIDLKSAKNSLKDFCEAKKVGDGDTDRYLVMAYWLKENLNLTEVTMDHIHTCYRFLDWQTPTDASAPLRNMKQKGWFNKGAAKGAYAINHVGENKVMGMANGK